MTVGAPLQVLPQTLGADLAAAERAAAAFLAALGVPTPADTPGRMARAYAELFTPRAFELTTFPNDEGYDELVLARVDPGAVGMRAPPAAVRRRRARRLPARRADPRPVQAGPRRRAFARRPQVQERLTKQVADWLQTNLRPRGVGVVIEAEHTVHDAARRAGGRAPPRSPRALLGALRDDPRSRAEFFALAGLRP